ncbi:lipid-binding SYLF domain-containing protein [Hwanghaeella sp.]|uniref:lipid-binding SYLF domain-containing protein n=1 Tax=Hwanghaeella sp. TaxID=2605943 RepID=UPI003CCBD2FD
MFELTGVKRVAAATVMTAALAFGMAAPVSADETADNLKTANEIVSKAVFTAEKMRNHKDFASYVKGYMKKAKGVVLFPQILKGGFFVGGEGGSGVLLAKAEDGRWSYPTFVGMGAASFGLQIGAQSSELMLIVLTGKGLEAILDDKVKIGGEINGAVGPYGAGAEASTTANLNADVIAYSISQGAFIGVSIEGAAVFPRESLNAAFYGTNDASPKSVVIDGKFANSAADPLREELANYPAGK